jgi:hypothetical protein
MSKFGDRAQYLTPVVRRAGTEARRARADAREANLAPIIAELQAAGVTSLKGVAEALNERGIHAMQVSRPLKRLAG